MLMVTGNSNLVTSLSQLAVVTVQSSESDDDNDEDDDRYKYNPNQLFNHKFYIYVAKISK